jgi:hypothetical protein
VENKKNRVIEIHDSVLERLLVENGNVVLYFSHLYVHESEGEPGKDPGTGWSQEGRLTIFKASVEGSFSEWPAHLHGGYISINGAICENEIPISLDAAGRMELRLQSWSDVIFIVGEAAKVELIGEPTYVEEFPGNS